MKNLIVAGVVGVAAVSAFAIYSSQNKTPEMTALPPVSITSPADIKEQLTENRPVRNVASTEAQAALTRMGLWEPSDTISWDSRTGENGNYTFSNLNISSADGDNNDVMSAAEMEISGVRLLDGEIPYYDTVTASDMDIYIGSDKTDVSVGRLGVNMPDSAKITVDLQDQKEGIVNSPVDYMKALMKPGTLPALPEIFVENLQTSKTRKVREYTSSKTLDVTDMLSSQVKPQYKEVTDTTSIGFAALTKVDGTESFNWQISNVAAENHNYRGKKNNFQLMSLDVSGLDSDIMDDLSFRNVMNKPGGGRSGLFDPIFSSLNLQGLKFESETDIFNMNQASVFHSDTKGDVFSRRVEIPQMTLSAKPLPQTNEGRPHSGNPFAELGYDDISFSVSSETSFDKTTGTISDNGSRISATDAFDMTVSYKISNIESGLTALIGFGRTQNASPIIEFGDLNFTDKGLLDRIFTQMSEERNMGEAEVKSAIKATFLLSKTMAKTEYQKELAGAANDAYAAFIDNGGKFRVTLRPQIPVSVADYFEEVKTQQAVEIYGEDKAAEIAGKAKEDLNSSMDNLLRDLNITFEHSIAD